MATLKKVEVWRWGLEEKWIRGAAMAESCACTEGKERRAHRRTQKENVFPKSFAWETRQDEFCEFLQLAGLKTYSFKGRWASVEQSTEGTTLLLERRQEKNSGVDSLETAT